MRTVTHPLPCTYNLSYQIKSNKVRKQRTTSAPCITTSAHKLLPEQPLCENVASCTRILSRKRCTPRLGNPSDLSFLCGFSFFLFIPIFIRHFCIVISFSCSFCILLIRFLVLCFLIVFLLVRRRIRCGHIGTWLRLLIRTLMFRIVIFFALHVFLVVIPILVAWGILSHSLIPFILIIILVCFIAIFGWHILALTPC